MPATDALQPSLSRAERTVVKTFGDWENFMLSFGLKPYDFDDIDEAKAIVKAFADDIADNADNGNNGET